MFGNSEQSFCNDRRETSEIQTSRKIKFVSGIDHYFSLHHLVSPNLSLASTTANLLPSNEMRSAVEFQALSVNHQLPTDNPHCYVDISSAPVQDNHSPFNEVSFSSLYSLEYSFPDYRGNGSRSYEQLNSENFIDARQNISSLPHQLYFKEPVASEQMSPCFSQKCVQNNLSLHQQHHNLKHDQSLSNSLNTKETDHFDFSYPSFAEPTCLASNWNLNNYLVSPLQTFGNVLRNSNCLENSKSFLEQSKSISSSKANKVVTGKEFSEEKHFISNLIPEKPVSNMTLENCNSHCISSNLLSEAPNLDVFKKEFVAKSSNLTSPYNDIKEKKEDVLKEKSDSNKVWNEKPKANEFNDYHFDAIRNIESSSTLPVKVNALKTSLKSSTLTDSKTSDLSFSEFKPQEGKQLGDCSVKEQNPKIHSVSPILSCQPTLIESHDFSPPEIETCRDTLPVECDSTTESSLQTRDLNNCTNLFLSNSDKTNEDTQTSSSKTLESDLRAESSLTAHRGTNANPPNKCRICKEFLFTERPLMQQFTVSIDTNYDVCNACNICFLQKSVLTTNSGDEKNPHKCTYCDRRFKKECYLVLHIKSHTTVKLFECSECNKAFSSSSKLKMHSKTHSGDKPFVCKECDRRFVQNSHLKMHSRVHFGTKLFNCNNCRKGFASKSRLSEHEKYHSPKLPFKCATCEKSFIKETYFESHLKIHCNAKPFECSNCKTRFAQKSILRQHTKNCRFVINPKDDSVPNQDFTMSSTEG